MVASSALLAGWVVVCIMYTTHSGCGTVHAKATATQRGQHKAEEAETVRQTRRATNRLAGSAQQGPGPVPPGHPGPGSRLLVVLGRCVPKFMLVYYRHRGHRS